MMKNSYKLIIYHLIASLYFLRVPKLSSSAQCCKTINCKKTDSNEEISIKHPFRVRDYQPESCGCPGFGLYCDEEKGLLLELPESGNFSVGFIRYDSYSRSTIELSDPNDCLAQKLLTLDLTTTPFREVDHSGDYKVYECHGNSHKYDNEKIDCLSGSDYTVVSDASFISVHDDNCFLLKSVSVPHEYAYYYDPPLNNISSIYLTWDENDCASCIEPWQPYRISWRMVLGIVLPITILLISLCYCYRQCMKQRNESSTARIINDTGARTSTTSAPTSTAGLDYDTIQSYPVVVVGDSDGQRKHENNMCPICLTEYSPKDTVKFLPNCLHRFHADCIDVWLKSKITCPICRTSPTQNLANSLL